MKWDMAEHRIGLRFRTTYENGLIGKKNRICAVQTVIRKSDMGPIWAKKSDLGHFSLQCKLSHRSV